MRPLILGLSVMGFAHGAVAGGFDSAYLRGSAAYDPSSYVVPSGLEPAAVASPAPAFVPVVPESVNTAIEFEIGARYMFSRGKLAKVLFDDPRLSGGVNSQLTYTGLTSHSGEIFARIDHGLGFFMKGYAGLGSFTKGNLQDEDFPPALDPYSSTSSVLNRGRLAYATVDAGYHILNTPYLRFGGFIGYQYLAEKLNAYGCIQEATNPFVCVPNIPSTIAAISEDAKWHSFRVGLSGDLMLTSRLKVSAEAAWVPYALVKSNDYHWLRIGTDIGDFSGPIPQTGNGSGIQLEGVVSYLITPQIAIGVGARWWHMKTNGTANLEHVIVGFPPELALAQPMDFKTDRYGVFAQASYRFGAL